MGTLDFGLHDILIYEMKNGEKKEENIWRRKIYLFVEEKKSGEGRKQFFAEEKEIKGILHQKNSIA